MNHHSSQEIREAQEQRMKLQAEQLELGPTGEFPQGKIAEHDEGEVNIAVGVDQGKVILNFGSPVAWIALDPPLARHLAESIRQQSRKAEA